MNRIHMATPGPVTLKGNGIEYLLSTAGQILERLSSGDIHLMEKIEQHHMFICMKGRTHLETSGGHAHNM